LSRNAFNTPLSSHRHENWGRNNTVGRMEKSSPRSCYRTLGLKFEVH
jgi:hypothetical protein